MATSEARLIRIEEVQDRLGVSRSTVYSLVRKHSGFPRPVHIGRALRWRLSDIERWIEASESQEEM